MVWARSWPGSGSLAKAARPASLPGGRRVLVFVTVASAIFFSALVIEWVTSSEWVTRAEAAASADQTGTRLHDGAKDFGESLLGGIKFVGVERWIVGYRAGAKQAAPGIATLNSYSNDFANPTKCRRAALSQSSTVASVRSSEFELIPPEVKRRSSLKS